MSHAFALILAISLSGFPTNTGLVTDAAGIFTPAEKTTLDTQLRAFAARRSVELAVVTVPSLDGQSIEEYAAALFKAYGIGKKATNNGVLLLVAPNDGPTGRVRIEVGYGLEPILTDGLTGQILRDVVKPGWRSMHRADGIISGANAIMKALEQPVAAARADPAVLSVATKPAPSRDDESTLFAWFLGMMTVLGTGAALVVAYLKKRERRQREARADERRAAEAARAEETRTVSTRPAPIPVTDDMRARIAALSASMDAIPPTPLPPPLRPRPLTPDAARAARATLQRTVDRDRRAARRSPEYPTAVPYVAPEPAPPPRREPERRYTDDTPSSNNGTPFDFGGGSSGGGGSSSDL